MNRRKIDLKKIFSFSPGLGYEDEGLKKLWSFMLVVFFILLFFVFLISGYLFFGFKKSAEERGFFDLPAVKTIDREKLERAAGELETKEKDFQETFLSQPSVFDPS